MSFTLTIDWLAFTLPESSAQEVIRVLGGDWVRGKAGFRGYPVSWITAEGTRGVGKLGTGAPRSVLEVHGDLSAGIVSTWPTEKVREVLRWILAHKGHVTRLDCALDDRQSQVPVRVIREAVERGQCITRAERFQIIQSQAIHEGTPSGDTLYFGSPQSQTMLRVYDKRLELQAKQREGWQDHGVRWELEFKQDRAQACAIHLAGLDEAFWCELVVGFLRSYVDFRDTTREADDQDRARALLLDWWKSLTDGFGKGRLVVEKDEQTLIQVKRWVSHAVAPMLAVICAEHPGGQAWLEKAIIDGTSRWKEKHRRLLKKKSQRAGSTPAAETRAHLGGTGVSSDSPDSTP
jgi:phage replication initiation protein